MCGDASVQFFEAQFRQQVRAGDLRLNPFEQRALPRLRGRVLDYGCGLGNLAVAAARQGCSVLALDASPTAIADLRRRALAESLPIIAAEEDLRVHRLEGEFDAVVCIGLLMFFDCGTAWRKLRELQEHLRPGGLAVVNVLEEGTTFMDMFDPQGHCLFSRHAIEEHFAGWDLLELAHEQFPAPHGTIKSFVTLIARKPGA